jgi:hypothetical protein
MRGLFRASPALVSSGGCCRPREVVVEGGAGRCDPCYRMQQYRPINQQPQGGARSGRKMRKASLLYNNARCLDDTAAAGSGNRSAATNGGPSRERGLGALEGYRLRWLRQSGLKPPADACLEILLTIRPALTER